MISVEEQKCIHEWKPNGLWDGKTPDGKPTGGIWYKCTKCGERATKLQVDEKGGTILEDFDVMGRPIQQ